jgi:hypothetical protein
MRSVNNFASTHCGSVGRAGHHVIRPVAGSDVVEPLLNCHVLSLRASRQISPPQHRMRWSEIVPISGELGIHRQVVPRSSASDVLAE